MRITAAQGRYRTRTIRYSRIEEKLPGAPVWYVPLPRMTDVDEPLKRDLPAFEHRLADAIREAVLAPPKTVDCSHLTWDALAARLLGFIAAL